MVQELAGQKRATRPGAAAATCRTILVPVDMSVDSHPGLDVALDLQRAFGSEVHVVTFTEFGENESWSRGVGAEIDDDDLEASSLGRLRRFVENVAPGALARVTCRAVEDNDVPAAIDRYATTSNATLVILASHHPPSLFRSRLERIVQTLDIPVLVLKGPA